MATRNQAQLAFDEEVIDDAAIEAALEEREKRKASLSAVRGEFKQAHDEATAAIAAIKLEVGSAARIGRFRITRTTLKARSVSFETIETSEFGGPPHVTFRVSAVGSTDAGFQAKAEARAAGWRTKTLCRYALVGPDDALSRTTRREWLVTLAAWPPAGR